MSRFPQMPLIGVTLAQYDPAQGASSPHGPSIGPPMNGARSGYFEMLIRAGAIPVGIPLETDPRRARWYMAKLDGIVFTGGEDISATYYGTTDHPTSLQQLNPARDAWEFALLEEALRRERSVLGICRGAELLLVEAGAHLCQHIPDRGEQVIHDVMPGDRSGARWYAEAHTLQFPEGHRFITLTGSQEIAINSLHHQGCTDFGDNRLDLRAIAHAEDGIIELFEGTGAYYRILGIQGHAEALIHRALTQGNQSGSGYAWMKVVADWVDRVRI